MRPSFVLETGLDLQACRDKLNHVLAERSSGNANELASAAAAVTALHESQDTVPVERQPDPDTAALSPVEDRSWLSSALNKAAQLERWTAKTPRPAPVQALTSSSPEDDPIQSAEQARTSSQHPDAGRNPPCTDLTLSAKKGAGWRTAAHRLGLASHRGHPRQQKHEADLISPWHGAKDQLAPAPSPPASVQAQPQASPQAEQAYGSPNHAEASTPMQQDGLVEPVSEPSMRKKRSAAARAMPSSGNENQHCNVQPADPIVCSHPSPLDRSACQKHNIFAGPLLQSCVSPV